MSEQNAAATESVSNTFEFIKSLGEVTAIDRQVLYAIMDGLRQKDIKETLSLTSSQVSSSIDRLILALKCPRDVRTWKAVRKRILYNLTLLDEYSERFRLLANEVELRLNTFDF